MTKIVVLKGGISHERDVSLASGTAVAKALRATGYEVVEIDVGHDISEVLKREKPSAVFNALHGTYGEDGCIQGVLEFLEIPYTHSGVLASSVAMHKAMAKKLFSAAAIDVPGGKFAQRSDLFNEKRELMDAIKRPYVIKPVADGSSVGVRIVFEGDKVFANDDNMPQSKEVLVEEYISGRELTVAVLDGEPMGIIEICPKDGFYNYQNKYTSGMTNYVVPKDLSKETYNQAMEWAARAHLLLGCRGVSRSDFRLSEDGKLFMLELNTHPGMTSTSLVPKIAATVGMSFEDLVTHLIESATLDYA